MLLLVSSVAFGQSIDKLHRKSIIADTHNDILSIVVSKGYNIDDDLTGKTHTDTRRLLNSGVDIQVFSIFCDERFGKGSAFNYALREIDSLDAIAARNPGKIVLVNSPYDLRKALKEKKIGALKGVEGGHMIEDNLQFLDSLHKRGARYLTLTWNNSTSWATSAASETQGLRPFGTIGLTDFGKQVVARMNQLGMMVDLSHVGEKTFYDVIGVTKKPVIASHSSVYALCPHRRNLKDDQIKAIGKNGGVIFVNFYSGFIDSNYEKRKTQFLSRHQSQVDSLKQLKLTEYEIDEWISKKYPKEAEALRPSLSLLVDHIAYIVAMIGVDHVGLGSDFDGIESAPIGLEGVQDFPKITQALRDRGFSKGDIRKIIGENFIRVFKQNHDLN